MPRLASSRGTRLSDRNSENITNVTSIKGKGVLENRTRSATGTKRQAEEPTLKAPEYNAKTRRRAALGEITNVSVNQEYMLVVAFILARVCYMSSSSVAPITLQYEINLYIGQRGKCG